VPRRYRLGERAASIRATRDRILAAAMALYAEIGISRATLREIGTRADVAPGTLRSHFPTRVDLDRAIVDRLAALAPLPEPAIFHGATGIADRIARLMHAGAVFSEQARPLYRMWLREPMLTAPWAEKGAEYGSRWNALMRAALGPLADDGDAMAVVRAAIHPQFFESLRVGGRSGDDAASLAAEVVTSWLVEREAQRT
jgi:AcrR family transcriptional regulator